MVMHIAHSTIAYSLQGLLETNVIYAGHNAYCILHIYRGVIGLHVYIYICRKYPTKY